MSEGAPHGEGARPTVRKRRQARTRAKLMRSAARLFCQRGLADASIDEIARRAGYTKGAFYSNFKSKEELFLAMLDQKFGEELERIEGALHARGAPQDAAGAAGEDFARFLRADSEWQRLYLEFVTYAARDDEFRQELLTRVQAMDERVGVIYSRWTGELGISPPLPLEDITRMTWMMADGFMLRLQIDPDLSEELYGTMLSTFMLGLGEVAKARQEAPAP